MSDERCWVNMASGGVDCVCIRGDCKAWASLERDCEFLVLMRKLVLSLEALVEGRREDKGRGGDKGGFPLDSHEGEPY